MWVVIVQGGVLVFVGAAVASTVPYLTYAATYAAMVVVR